MIEEIKKHIVAVEEFTTSQVSEVEEFRIKYLGKKGILKQFFAEFKNVPNDQKKEFGMTINKLQNLAAQKTFSTQNGPAAKVLRKVSSATRLVGSREKVDSCNIHPCGMLCKADVFLCFLILFMLILCLCC